MPKNIYAFLVGINEYSGNVTNLEGCCNDVDQFHDYLSTRFKKNLHVEVLKNSDATRENIITVFREHLGKATADDVALFQYCGHGAQCLSAPEFKAFFPDGKDEGLVCYDSRTENGYDLADKELAVLLAEIAKNDPHITVILDSCHSGSATRDIDELNMLKPRFTAGKKEPRPLESYLDGFYENLVKEAQKAGRPLIIPSSRHIALAACDRKETAKENPQIPGGIFTNTLLDVLKNTPADLSYKDVFLRSRSTVRKRAMNQSPQFDTYMNFNANEGFLGGPAVQSERFIVEFTGEFWKLAHGAIYGLPNDPEKTVELALYAEDEPDKLAGTAATTVVGPTESEIKLNFKGHFGKRYQAEITSFPLPPAQVYLEGDQKSKQIIEKALDENKSLNAIFSDVAEGLKYGLFAANGNIKLEQLQTGQTIQWVDGISTESANGIFESLQTVLNWEKNLALQNDATAMDPSKVDYHFSEILADGSEHIYDGGEVDLDFVETGDDDEDIDFNVKCRNRTSQELHIALFHFSKEFGVTQIYNNPLIPGEEFVILNHLEKDRFMYLDEDENETIEIFKLIVSTEKVDSFYFEQDELEIGEKIDDAPTRAIGKKNKKKKLFKNEWFTKTIRVRLIRRVDEVSERDISLANGQITIKGHPSAKANLSISAAKTNSRSVDDNTGFYQFLEQHGLNLLDFAPATRDAENAGLGENILELTDIQNAEALAKNPLELELNTALAEDEYILPLVFDGEDILLAGEFEKDDRGFTHISIDHIPEIKDNRRSLGKALKLYFFKTYLKRDNVNQLCWVEYKDDGSVKRHKSNVANKIAEAKNIILLVHGIIGDTDVIAKGLPLACGEKGNTLNQQFDLVLAYDYENLSTPISDTAARLKQQLEVNGISENDDKRLTILAHSMGGLVSRWFIEQLGGNKIVDHLVMCGTPNNGSPFGKVDRALKLFQALTMVGIKTFPPLASYGGAIMVALKRLKKITPTLEMMNPDSDFIKTLNGSGDPSIPYTILAGDIEEYEETGEAAIAKLLDKVGKGMLFDVLYGNQPHDIAVSVDSILSVDNNRTPTPQKSNVACHHLNYFISQQGLKALAAVKW